MAKIKIKFPDGSVSEFEKGISIIEVAKSIGKKLAEDAIAAKLSNELVDLNTKINKDSELKIITFKDAEGKEIFRHSSSHLMAQAIKNLYPDVKFAIGPAVDEGFYYDIDLDEKLTPEDLVKIEEEMKKIVDGDIKIERDEVSKKEALNLFNDNPYKQELIKEIKDEKISIYKQGNFIDFCRGPHVQRTSQIGAAKLLEASGAYFKGDERNEMLQRIYGTAFGSKKELNAYFARLEELRKRDHRLLGRKLDLFSFHPEAPASPFFHARGTIVYNQLLELMREKYRAYGYDEVITPQVFDVDLWKTSGHYDNYRDDMFFADAFDEVEERSNSLKPMNCPAHCLLFGAQAHSYRDLPIRIADFGRLHRYERSGVVTGLTRVRTFAQDDAHIFCTTDQIEEEIEKLFDFIFEIYAIFGFSDINVYLSTRPEKAMGDPAIWEHAEAVLTSCLESDPAVLRRESGRPDWPAGSP